jgi:selenocysteine lyase/cysteine desulfurase
MASYKEHYRRFLDANPGRLHFAAHSHHLWPDVTRDAVVECWDDAARLVDGKWDRILGEVVPRAQAHVARVLDLSRPEQIAFAPNTHELVVRLLSCLLDRSPLRILTTDSEFMSFARQAARLEELASVAMTRVPTEPFETFEARFRETAASASWDLVYFSQVFYNSGLAIADLPALVNAVRSSDALVVVDGYHGFLAIPTSLRAIEDRAFYLAGGYKYAMSGEGACFLHVPASCHLRPVDTGWFASFGRLAQAPARGVEYSEDGYRFWGATFDPSSLYRFNSVMDWLNRLGVGVADIRAHVLRLQERFLASLETSQVAGLSPQSLLTPRAAERRGNFLTFRLAQAETLAYRLRESGVITDHRSDRLRFGFGLYQDPEDVDELLRRLASL